MKVRWKLEEDSTTNTKQILEQNKILNKAKMY